MTLLASLPSFPCSLAWANLMRQAAADQRELDEYGPDLDYLDDEDRWAYDD